MNKTAIKNFAVWARTALISAVTKRASEYDVTEDGLNDPAQETVNGRLLTAEEKAQRSQLIAAVKEKGFSQAMEEAAYTWFSRSITLRFMEVNGYLPSRTGISSDTEGELSDLLREGLPEMFGTTDGWTELLLPGDLLHDDSLTERMAAEIPEEDWKDQVQIVGWLHQYYNTEQKDRIFADLKRNIKISAEAIPAATQLFTPDWIVRYMVENSLGRLWTEGHGKPEAADWMYYIEEAEQEEAVKAELAKIREKYRELRPEQIRFLDPCMGTGHILVYAFDVLMEIHTSCGWPEREAARSILRNNLFGLDIDRRAYRLAYFSLMMKARKFDDQILNAGIMPNLASFDTVSRIDAEPLTGGLRELAEQLKDGEIFGSLMDVTAPEGLDRELSELEGSSPLSREQLHTMLRICRILGQRYDVVCTNPPYMGGSGMNGKLAEFVKDKFADYKSDLFSAFVVKCAELTKNGGLSGFLTPYVWMFIQSYEKLRSFIYSSQTIETLIQFEYSAFEEATVPICSFVLRKGRLNKKGSYFRLTDFRGGMEVQRQKVLEAIADRKCGFYYERSSDNFSQIPGMPVAYWAGEAVSDLFASQERLAGLIDARIGMVSGDNDRFLRYWSEVDLSKIEFSARPGCDPMEKKWYPLQKGGDGRLWYGDLRFVVNWENDGYELKNDNFMGSRVRSHNYNGQQQFKEGITWNSISSSRFTCRYAPPGCTFDAAGPLCEVKDRERLLYVLAFLSSCVTRYFFSMINPTMNFPSGYLGLLPFISAEEERASKLAEQCIELSRRDWDSFETSWDFERHPLI
ncbi:MAG: BREX-1 system adenine-specific DNA-methyltransferase PglX [Ruminococcus sp.]|nr:BREX-1 system adenine-specific DNA-methyltransferase PglX [Ruminococcus sp.]